MPAPYVSQREVDCWGFNPGGMLDPPAGDYRSVSAGASHACAVRESGEVDCWGFIADGTTDAPREATTP